MKTIFITIFEGIEAKNILRTDIIKTILSVPDIHIVLLVKSEERAAYHRSEFGGNNISYEVVRPEPMRGTDWFFTKLKFPLLRTETTKLWRTLLYEKRGNRLLFIWGEFLNVLLARPFLIRFSRFLDWILVRNMMYRSLFEKYKPDLVFVANLFDEPEVHLVRESKKRGVRTVCLINSWDRVTSRCLLRLLADKFIVWNDLIKKDLIELHLVPEDDIYTSGIPQYDDYFRVPYKSRTEFFKRLKLNPDKPFIVYAPFGLFYDSADWEVIDFLYKLIKAERFGKDVSLLVRCPPNDDVDTSRFEQRPDLVYEFPGRRFSVGKTIDWDMTRAELEHLADTLYYMSVMVCFASSISVDAAIVDRPVINIAFDFPNRPKNFINPTRLYGKRHYQQALRPGGIRFVHSINELVEVVRLYLNDPTKDREGRRRLSTEQCHFLDGKSGKRIGKYLLSLLS